MDGRKTKKSFNMCNILAFPICVKCLPAELVLQNVVCSDPWKAKDNGIFILSQLQLVATLPKEKVKVNSEMLHIIAHVPKSVHY